MTTAFNQLSDDTKDALRELVEINVDSSKGFETAADAIDDSACAQLFRTIAKSREDHVAELRAHVEVDGEEDGSLLGKVHRWWIDIRSKIQGGDTHAILTEAERGEDEIKERYEKLQPEIAGNPLNDVLLKHYAEVKRNHALIRELRGRAESAD